MHIKVMDMKEIKYIKKMIIYIKEYKIHYLNNNNLMITI